MGDDGQATQEAQDLSTCKEGIARMGSRWYKYSVFATLVWRIAVSASQRPRQHGTRQSAALPP